MRLLTFSLLLLLQLPALLWAVDRDKFKKCEQSGFCKRHRNKMDNPHYFVVPASVQLNDSAITATLESTENKLQLVVAGLKDSTVRVFITEEGTPLHPRFHPSIALDGEPQQEKVFAIEKGDSSATFIITGPDAKKGSSHKIVLNYRPFRIDVFKQPQQKKGEGELVMSVNSRNLLKVEHFREKKGAEEGQEGEGFWEETFKSHTDTKPYGSSSVGLDISFIGFKYIYGLPEHADSHALRSTAHTDPYRLYNLDVFEYEINNGMALYGAVPFVTAHSKHNTVGGLWLNAAETWIDVHSSTADKGVLAALVDKLRKSEETPQMDLHFISESGVIDLYLYLGPKPMDVFRQNSLLTGVTPLPPIASIAYHQCRWNYNDRDDLLNVHAKFDEHDIPVDVLWLDIEHTDGKKYFTWDPVKFSNPKEMIQQLEEKGRHLVTVIDPHIKKDDNYFLYKEAKEKGYFVKNANGDSDFEGHCWPGQSSYLDFLNPVVRDYWANIYQLDKYEGSTEGLWTWNDMNEPSVFTGPEITMPKDAKHGEWEHRDIHNINGFLTHISTYEGHLRRSQHQLRPFVLTRSFFVGSQRYAAVWTGDNAASWDHLKASVPMLLSLSVAGIPFAGADVGGFFGNPDEQLLVRWYEAGAFQPFFRAHAHIDAKRREPWLYSDTALAAIRTAIRRRYTFLPYW